MSYVKDLGEQPLTLETVGAKAAGLGSLRRLGFKVPQGFVVTAAAHSDFFGMPTLRSVVDAELRGLRSSDYMVMAIAAKHVRDVIAATALPASIDASIRSAVEHLQSSSRASAFAVRSSSAFEDSESQSWAGQFDTYLDVSAADVVESVKRCWASFFGSRAMSYRLGAGQTALDAAFGVIVQVYIPGEVSGVAFSIDPATGEKDRVLIEAVRGTGDRLVSGQASPYAIAVDKEELLVLKRRFGEGERKDLLNSTTIAQIAASAVRVEKDLGRPADIEWTVLENKLYLLQARPVTAVAADSEPADLGPNQLPDIRNYELTFKVSGLGFLFADLLCRGFGYLDPLFTSDGENFRQYFTNNRMEFAAREGVRWLSRPDGFTEYREEFERFHAEALPKLSVLVGDGAPTASAVQEFFSILAAYFQRYSRMDFQFTNLTYLYADENAVVAANLNLLSEFKDVARVWINEVSIDEQSLFAKMLAKLSAAFAISFDELDRYKVSDLIDLFSPGGPLRPIDLAERASFLAYVVGEETCYVTGDRALTYTSDAALLEAPPDESVVVGQVANGSSDTTYLEGIVRRINVDYSDLETMDQHIAEMRAGEILVSEFTAPELMGACAKASAIVTDLGGMLSHAAIVSRELGIPCVVGTRYASQAFETGDRVGINIASGVVELLR